MHVLIDTTTVHKPHSGTGVYANGLREALFRLPPADRITLVGGDAPPPCSDSHVSHFFPGETNWHRAVNLRMAANRPNFSAEIAFFPNYFMPPGFPIPSLVTIHDVSFLSHPRFYSRRFSAYYRRRIRHTLRHARLILTVSRASKRAIHELLGVSEERIRVISPGPSLTAPAGFGPPAARPYFLYAGTIEPKKNVAAMIDGFLNSGIGSHDLVLAGYPAVSRGYFRQVQHRAERSGGRVRYVGFVPEQELAALYAGAAGIVNLSHIEGYSFPIRDAFHFRKPSLVSEDAALQEMCCGHAVTVDASDPEAVEAGFRQLASCSPGAAFECYARQLDERNSWERFSERISDVMEEVTHQPMWPAGSPKSASEPIRAAVIRSVCYAGCFGAPASIERMHRALPGAACSPEELTAVIRGLAERHPDRIKIENDHLSLRFLLIDGENVRAARSANRAFIREHRRLIGLLRRLPWCRQMFFSGNTVHGSPARERDLDLFVVSARNRVWILFTLIRLAALLTRKHRVVCNNYMVDEDAAALACERDFYSAFELIHLQPVSARDCPEMMLRQNEWVYSFFPNAAPEDGPVAEVPAKRPRWRWPSLLNLMLMACWTWRWNRMGLRNGTAGVRWDAHRIKLHVEDHRPAIHRRFRRLLQDAEAYLSEETLRRTA